MKRLNLDHLDSWLAVIETTSFHAAAKRLSRSQATVSQHVQRLENYIGGKLVDRGQQGCAPTPLGRRLAPIARSLISGEKQASDLFSQNSPRLGACSNIGVYLLPQLLVLFTSGQPKPLLHIGTNPEIVGMLEDGFLDIGLLEFWQARKDDLVARPWRRERMVAICAPGHCWTGRSRIAVSDLSSEALIGGEPGTGTGRLLREMFAGGVPLPKPAMELGSTEAVKRAVAAGLGVSIVPEMSSRSEIEAGRLQAFPLAPDVYKTLWLVRRAELESEIPLYSWLENSADASQSSECS